MECSIEQKYIPDENQDHFDENMLLLAEDEIIAPFGMNYMLLIPSKWHHASNNIIIIS